MKTIKSIEDYITAIMNMKKLKDDLGFYSYQWFFRGQKDSSWSVLPNAFREGKLKNEYTVIQNAIRQNPFEFRSLTEFETLTKLQHYGLGTRLLDVTLNPLVALYFATESAITYEQGKDKRYRRVEKDGVIFFKHAPWHSVNELGVRIAMVIPFIDFDDSFTVDSLLDYLYQNNVVSDSEYNLLQRDNYKLFIEYIQENYFIVSTHSNERLIRQSGAFVLPTAIKINGGDSDLNVRKIEKAYLSLNDEFEEDFFVIPSKYKAQIRENLDFFNINEATMFPELEHQMTYIQGKNCIVSGGVPLFQLYEQEVLKSFDNDYNNETPNIGKIVDVVLGEASPKLKNQLVKAIEQETGYVDWKSKHQIRSQIRVTVSRKLQSDYSAAASKRYASRILELLLNPTKDCVESEG